MERWIQNSCEALGIGLSYDMPAGYEDANGTFDVCCNTLFLNKSLLEQGENWKTAFYLFHELRHGQQYKQPETFPAEIRESLPYVILYNGLCYKLQENEWEMCKLDGEESWLVNLYLSLPYELDANRYAYEKAAEMFPGEKDRLSKLYSCFLPQRPVPFDTLKEIFRKIDEAVQKK